MPEWWFLWAGAKYVEMSVLGDVRRRILWNLRWWVKKFDGMEVSSTLSFPQFAFSSVGSHSSVASQLKNAVEMLSKKKNRKYFFQSVFAFWSRSITTHRSGNEPTLVDWTREGSGNPVHTEAYLTRFPLVDLPTVQEAYTLKYRRKSKIRTKKRNFVKYPLIS